QSVRSTCSPSAPRPSRVDRDATAALIRPEIPDDLNAQHVELLAHEGHHYSRITEPIERAILCTRVHKVLRPPLSQTLAAKSRPGLSRSRTRESAPSPGSHLANPCTP